MQKKKNYTINIYSIDSVLNMKSKMPGTCQIREFTCSVFIFTDEEI